jgi:L-seryl-tRNA(Ser) seleniumtransferase
MATIYERLGVRPVVNGAATLTRLGGSLMPPPVVEAMVEGARAFVPLDKLQAAAGRRIAELTHNEACYITSGAAAGLVLATAACVTGNDPAKMALLPHPDRIPGGRYKVVIQRSQRVGYDFAVRQTGIELVEVGPTRAEAASRQTTPDELEGALDDRTAAVIFIAGANNAPGALPIEDVVRIAHGRGVPVIVDAAAQIPPVENLWYFSGGGGPALWAQALAKLGVPEAPNPVPKRVEPAGADLAIFSGGKGLCGPQSAGLVLGRADLVEAMARQACPNALIGRPMKVGKEEMCGMVAAVEWYLSLDYVALAAQYERHVQHVLDALADLPGITAKRAWPNEAGQPLPRLRVIIGDAAGTTRDEVQRRLLASDPPVELSGFGSNGLYVNPQTMRDGDEVLVADTLRRALTADSARAPEPALAAAR